MLYHWIEKYPEYLSKPHVRHYKQATAELKEQAIRHCLIDGEPVRSIAEDIGYTEFIVYQWLRSYREKGICFNMKKAKKTTPSDLQAADNIEDPKEKMLDMQMEIAILKETINVLKKDPGVDQTVLRNREKAVIIGALKNKYSLPKLCFKLEIPGSSYYYQKAALRADDKYRELRSRKFNKTNTRMFFDVIDRRYNKEGPNTLILTSNLQPSRWGDFFGENSSLLCSMDRIFDMATVFNIKGQSYRGKQLQTVTLAAGQPSSLPKASR